LSSGGLLVGRLLHRLLLHPIPGGRRQTGAYAIERLTSSTTAGRRDKLECLSVESFFLSSLKYVQSLPPGLDNQVSPGNIRLVQGILMGMYHCTIDLLLDWFEISCMTTDNFFA